MYKENPMKISKKHAILKFFDLKKRFEKIFLSISIRNFLRIPKIALRNSCDEFKASKNKKSKFLYKFSRIRVAC